MTNFVPVLPGDSVVLRKPHPCGSYAWSITRVGADIGLRCESCGRRVMLAREEFERRVRSVSRPESQAVDAGAQAGKAS